MSQVGYEPTIPVFEQTKTVHAWDREATLIGFWIDLCDIFPSCVDYVLECFHFKVCAMLSKGQNG
jgi:hypothetical protein